jgi:hypothetical protein
VESSAALHGLSAAPNSHAAARAAAIVKNGAMTIGAFRQIPARLYTGNFNLLKRESTETRKG